MFAARQQGSRDIICYVSSLLILQGAIEIEHFSISTCFTTNILIPSSTDKQNMIK